MYTYTVCNLMIFDLVLHSSFKLGQNHCFLIICLHCSLTENSKHKPYYKAYIVHVQCTHIHVPNALAYTYMYLPISTPSAVIRFTFILASFSLTARWAESSRGTILTQGGHSLTGGGEWEPSWDSASR